MGISTTPTAVAKMVRITYEHWLAAQTALRRSDWTTYGKEIKAVGLGLKELREATRPWEGLTFPRIPVRYPLPSIKQPQRLPAKRR